VNCYLFRVANHWACLRKIMTVSCPAFVANKMYCNLLINIVIEVILHVGLAKTVIH